MKNTSKLIEFLEFMLEVRVGDCSPEVHNTLLELYLQSYKNEIKEDVSFRYPFDCNLNVILIIGFGYKRVANT